MPCPQTIFVYTCKKLKLIRSGVDFLAQAVSGQRKPENEAVKEFECKGLNNTF